jgi:hypothetical protein
MTSTTSTTTSSTPSTRAGTRAGTRVSTRASTRAGSRTGRPGGRAGTTAPSAAQLVQAAGSLDRAERALSEARAETHADRRYVSAHVAALRATAAVLSVRTRPQGLRRQTNAWVLLERVAPELAEWAAFFAAGAPKRAAAEAGHVRAVSERDADDLVRDVEQFLHVVERAVGLPQRLDLATGRTP